VQQGVDLRLRAPSGTRTPNPLSDFHRFVDLNHCGSLLIETCAELALYSSHEYRHWSLSITAAHRKSGVNRELRGHGKAVAHAGHVWLTALLPH
jgi:hypothetical protein